MPLFINDIWNSDVELYEWLEYNRIIDLMTYDYQMYCNISNKLLNSYCPTSIYSFLEYLIIYLNRGKRNKYGCKFNFI